MTRQTLRRFPRRSLLLGSTLAVGLAVLANGSPDRPRHRSA